MQDKGRRLRLLNRGAVGNGRLGRRDRVDKPEGESTTGEPTTVGSRPSAQTGPSGTTKPETINVHSGLNSTNTSKVLRYYKAAAANTKSIDATQLMSIKRVDYTPRNSFQKGMLSLFTGIASAALAANSTPVNEVPGVPDELSRATSFRQMPSLTATIL